MNMRNRAKSFCTICAFMSFRGPEVNEGEYKASIHYLKWADIPQSALMRIKCIHGIVSHVLSVYIHVVHEQQQKHLM